MGLGVLLVLLAAVVLLRAGGAFWACWFDLYDRSPDERP